MKISIQVTQDDIDKGERAKRCACPVWRAISRAAPYLDELKVVYLYAICRGRDGGPEIITLPDAAATFIHRFDHGTPVAPFTFDLDIPDELIPAVTR